MSGGLWGGVELIPPAWVARMRQPCSIAPFYGWLTWLNRDGQTFPGASAQSSFMVGAGGHYVWMEPHHDAVIVARWLDPQHAPEFMASMSLALSRPHPPQPWQPPQHTVG